MVKGRTGGATGGKAIDVSAEEQQRLAECFRDPEFMKLFTEYAKEIQDPANRKAYEDDLLKMEREAAGPSDDVEMLKPEPGFCIKARRTDSGQGKVFLNMSSSPLIAEAEGKLAGNKRGRNWRIPYSLAGPRRDYDKSGNQCQVVDVVFSPNTMKMALVAAGFKQVLISTAVEGLAKAGVQVDPHTLILMKRKSMGTPAASVLRRTTFTASDTAATASTDASMPMPMRKVAAEVQEIKRAASSAAKKVVHQHHGLDSSAGRQQDAAAPEAALAAMDALLGQSDTSAAAQLRMPGQTSATSASNSTSKPLIQEVATEPEHQLVHRGVIDMQNFIGNKIDTAAARPRELVLQIKVPGVTGAAEMDLEINERLVALQVPQRYALHKTLPYPVDSETVKAEFDGDTSTLELTMMVLPPSIPSQPMLPVPDHLPAECDEEDAESECSQVCADTAVAVQAATTGASDVSTADVEAGDVKTAGVEANDDVKTDDTKTRDPDTKSNDAKVDTKTDYTKGVDTKDVDTKDVDAKAEPTPPLAGKKNKTVRFAAQVDVAPAPLKSAASKTYAEVKYELGAATMAVALELD